MTTFEETACLFPYYTCYPFFSFLTILDLSLMFLTCWTNPCNLLGRNSVRNSMNYFRWWRESLREGEGMAGGRRKDKFLLNSDHICYKWSKNLKYGTSSLMILWDLKMFWYDLVIYNFVSDLFQPGIFVKLHFNNFFLHF